MAQAAGITSQQSKILETVARAKKPLSAYDILARLGDIKSPPTVYRALEKLQLLGLIHRLESLNAYVACRHTHGSHSHDPHDPHGSQFAICTACGSVEELNGKPLKTIVKQAKDSFLARVEKQVVELSGICRTCERAGS